MCIRDRNVHLSVHKINCNDTLLCNGSACRCPHRPGAVSYTHLDVYKRQYCVCTSEGKDSRVLGHLFRRAGVKHFYQPSITGIDPPALIYFQRSHFQQYRDAGYLTYDVMYRKSMWQLMLEKKIPPLRKMCIRDRYGALHGTQHQNLQRLFKACGAG